MKEFEKTYVTSDLLRLLKSMPENEQVDVIISVKAGCDTKRLAKRMQKWLNASGAAQTKKIELTENYLFCPLDRKQIVEIQKKFPEIVRIWHDKPCQGLLDQSGICINAVSAQHVFSAYGEGICWAVLDSGIDHTHPHFQHHANILPEWKDFIGDPNRGDVAGHGTAVAGIIAGEGTGDARELVDFGFGIPPVESIRQGCQLTGIAPKAKVYDIRILNAQLTTPSSRMIQAMRYVRMELNCRTHVIHGVNISVGCSFDPNVYGAGHTPLCEEAERLANSGVIVCVAAGNDGYLPLEVRLGSDTQIVPKLVPMSINDPANADKVIAVGSCHKENPHTYGVSYFSSKGPTSDGRLKPDLLAPGEKILTCLKSDDYSKGAFYGAATGTSFACPHVSGAIAAFLSVKREFIGRSEFVKQIFIDAATDLGREATFQGHGLINLLRTLERI